MKNICNQIYLTLYKMRIGLGDQTCNQSSNKVNDKIYNQARVQGLSRVKQNEELSRIRINFFNQVRDKVRDKVRDEEYNQIRNKVVNQLTRVNKI